jgi:hypothetical protein
MENNKYPIGGFAPGDYWHESCVDCKSTFFGDKRAVQCEPCAIRMVNGEPKKEVAKEVPERMYSKEEVLNILDKFLTSMIKDEKTGLIEKWFEQFSETKIGKED